MKRKQRSGARMIVILMSLWLIFPFGACSTLNNDTAERGLSPAASNGLLDDRDIQQCLSSIRPHENPEHYYRRGRYLQDRNKHRLAILEFKSAIAVKPDYVDAYNALGISCDITGDFDSAAKAYNEAISLDPKRGDILNNLGYSCLLRKQYRDAVICFEKAVTLDQGNPRYQNNLGLAYAEDGQFEPALKAFRKTTDAADAHVKLAGILRKNGHDRAADQHLYLASALKEGYLETDKLLEQTVLPEPAEAILEEDISEDVGEAFNGEAISGNGEEVDIVSAGKKEVPATPVRKTSMILDPVAASLSVFAAYTADVPPVSDTDSDATAVPDTIIEEELTANLDSDQQLEPADSEPILLQPEAEIEVLEFEALPAPVQTDDPVASQKPAIHAQPADAPGQESETGEIIGGTDTEIIAPIALQTVSPIAPETHAVPAEIAPVEGASAATPVAIVAEILSNAVADEPENASNAICVEIISAEGMQAITEKIETGLDRTVFRIDGVRTFGEAETDYPLETLVYYCEGYLQEAWAVARAIPGWQNMKKVSSLTPADIKIRAILWRDLMPR